MKKINEEDKQSVLDFLRDSLVIDARHHSEGYTILRLYLESSCISETFIDNKP